MKKADAKEGREVLVGYEDFKILRCHEFKDGNISFDMKLKGITLYGLTLVWYKKEKRYFIGFPSRKSGDSYYNHFWFPTDETFTEAVRAEIERMLNE